MGVGTRVQQVSGNIDKLYNPNSNYTIIIEENKILLCISIVLFLNKWENVETIKENDLKLKGCCNKKN